MIYIGKSDLEKQRELVGTYCVLNRSREAGLIDGLLNLLDVLIENSEGQWVHTEDENMNGMVKP